eukprot:5461052-Pyramimonas_sp.AAC.1
MSRMSPRSHKRQNPMSNMSHTSSRDVLMSSRSPVSHVRPKPREPYGAQGPMSPMSRKTSP